MSVTRGDRGNSTVEFALVAPLLIGLALVILQAAFAIHVRTVLTAAAAEGARAAAMAGAQMAVGERRARELLQGNLAEGVVTGVHSETVRQDGSLVSAVTIDARLPLFGLLGPAWMQITGHAIREHV